MKDVSIAVGDLVFLEPFASDGRFDRVPPMLVVDMHAGVADVEYFDACQRHVSLQFSVTRLSKTRDE